jgi:hypothetical protein
LALLLHERVVAAPERSRPLLRALQRKSEHRARGDADLVERREHAARAEHDLGAELAALGEVRDARVAPEELAGRRQRERAEAAEVRDRVDIAIRTDGRPGDHTLTR